MLSIVVVFVFASETLAREARPNIVIDLIYHVHSWTRRGLLPAPTTTVQINRGFSLWLDESGGHVTAVQRARSNVRFPPTFGHARQPCAAGNQISHLHTALPQVAQPKHPRCRSLSSCRGAGAEPLRTSRHAQSSRIKSSSRSISGTSVSLTVQPRTDAPAWWMVSRLPEMRWCQSGRGRPLLTRR